MKWKSVLWWSSALCLGASALQAQETKSLDDVQKQLQQMQENFNKVVQEQQKKIEELNRQLEELRKEKGQAQAPPAAVAQPPGERAYPADLGSATNTSAQIAGLQRQVDELNERAKQKPKNIFNPAIGFVGEVIFSYDNRDNVQTGFERPGGWDVFLRSAELNLEASIDPYARGYAVVNASADAATGDASIEVEEAAVVTTSLPWNLTVQGGRFFGEFGRLSYVHNHELPFVNRPIVLEEYVFGESQTDGLQMNWLFPTKHYISLTAGAGLKFGELQGESGGFRSLSEWDYWSRLSTYFDLSPNLNLEWGVSGLLNPKADLALDDDATVTETKRRLVGTDITLRYQPLASNRYRGLEWGTEFLASPSKFDFDPDATAGSGDEFSRWNTSCGLYSYVAARLNRNWTVGFLFDWTQALSDNNINTYRYSPYLTWRPSEFQFLRLQYSYTDPGEGTGFSSDNGVFLQWVWIMGAHSHGFRQRQMQ